MATQKFASCPSCERDEIRIRFERDWADPILPCYRRFLLFWLDFKLYFCRACRLQFYDRRFTRKAVHAISTHKMRAKTPPPYILSHLFAKRKPLLQSRVKFIEISR